MAESLGIDHLLELSGTEMILGFLTPLFIFAAFFLAQVLLPAIRVPGYAIDPATGEPRRYRLNGLLVFAIAIVVWAVGFAGLPRDWFYRSSLYAVAGGTGLCALIAVAAVFSQPRGDSRNPLSGLWAGRTRELSLFNSRFDLKMYTYVVGGAMWALNALSGAAYHHERFGDDANPGVYLYAGFLTFYVLDYFVCERVQLYTYDMMHEQVGFRMLWGGLIFYGWLFILPLWGMAAHPHPGISPAWTPFWLAGTAVLFLAGWGISRGTNMQKYTFKRWPDRKFMGIIEPEHIQAGERKILVNGFWGVARHFNYMGEWTLALAIGLVFGHLDILWAWTYTIFILGFFTWRQIADDQHCAEKYGPEKWAEYQARVPYRIFPGVY
ncbi:MAG: DUF1295 domain-containing protein [bacterium]|nr:DUF1295 domain-containing protein [bacterium]